MKRPSSRGPRATPAAAVRKASIYVDPAPRRGGGRRDLALLQGAVTTSPAFGAALAALVRDTPPAELTAAILHVVEHLPVHLYLHLSGAKRRAPKGTRKRSGPRARRK